MPSISPLMNLEFLSLWVFQFMVGDEVIATLEHPNLFKVMLSKYGFPYFPL